MEYYAKSDTGRVRQMNEDFCFATDKPVGPLENLFVVCDGMGGHRAGEYASSLAVKKMITSISGMTSMDPFEVLSNGIEEANRAIYRQSVTEEDKAGMGTTVVAATFQDDTIFLDNVGDSRLYAQNDTEFWQVTRDHSYVEERVRKGILDRKEARFHRDRNKITRAVGVMKDVRIDFFDLDAIRGMRFLLCSDGLSSVLFDEEIAGIIGSGMPVRSRVEELIRQANERGGPDNITAVLIEM